MTLSKKQVMIDALKGLLETAAYSLQHAPSWTKAIAVVAALPIAGYAAFIAALLIPAVQRGSVPQTNATSTTH